MSTIAKVFTAAPVGYEGKLVEVESDTSRGLPGMRIVGLGNKSIEESKERVRSAITNSSLEYPSKRITINLAPAELPKDGTHYDLPIALAILLSSGQINPQEIKQSLFAGELALDGSIRPISGAINIAEAAKENNIKRVYLPAKNAQQASLVSGVEIFPVVSLRQLYLHLKGEAYINKLSDSVSEMHHEPNNEVILDDILGQEQAKRALIIAAAGHHNLLLSGPPGAGKSMLAKVLPGLLPPLTPEEQLAATKLHSLAGSSMDEIITARPFRSPHHTASQISLMGGGSSPRPGEISLAHLGVLYLDEIPEFTRSTIEALRQPLEDRSISVTRSNGRATYPANFMMVATMNPCPCGYFGDQDKECTCTPAQIAAYQKKLSGPLLDRIDLVVNVSRISNSDLSEDRLLTDSQQKLAKKIIQKALLAQTNRFSRSDKYNSNLSNRELKTFAQLDSISKDLLDRASSKLHLSPRSYFRIIRVARTIADLSDSEFIKPEHVAEALQYR